MPTPVWTLRPAREEDRDFLRRLHALSYREHVERVWGWDDAEQLGFFERRFRPERLQIVEAGGEDVGVLDVEDGEDELFLADLEVVPGRQGHGLGASIVRSLQERAAAAGKPLTLQVLHVNERARALYERLGFEEVWRDDVRARLRWRPPELVASSE